MKTIFLIIVLSCFTNSVSNAQITTKSNTATEPQMLSNAVIVRLKSGYSLREATNALAQSGARPIRQMLLPEQSARFNLSSPLHSEKLDEILKAEEPILRTYVVEYDSKMPPQRFCNFLLKNNSEIEIAEPYYIAQILGKPNDLLVNQQQLLTVIKAFEAWDITKGDSTVIIGICDNGIEQTHEDLVNSIAPNFNEIPNNGQDDDNNGYTDDYIGVNLGSADDFSKPGDTHIENYHGTSVAGIAGATTNNSLGIAGVGYKCRIFPIKAGRVGKEGVYYGNEGLIYAAMRGFKVVNCSWGIPNTYSRIQESIVNYVLSKGVVIVAAAGNSSNTVPWYPAGYPGVLGVGQVTIGDDVGSEAVGSHVAIMAPGANSITTTNTTQQYIYTFSGSSAASPVVAGVVAIVRSLHPELTARQAAELTRLSSDNIDANNPSVKGIVPGRVNMLKAVTLSPFASPSIRPIQTTYFVHNSPVTRFALGDTVTAVIKAYNYLGTAQNVACSLSVSGYIIPFSFIDSIGIINNAQSETAVNLPNFTFVVTAKTTSLNFIRVNMKASNYDDFFLLPIIPTSDIVTFENDSLRFSLGDVGSFGYSGNGVEWAGAGLDYKRTDNLIFGTSFGSLPDHTLILTEDSKRIETVSCSSSDFISEKNFGEPTPSLSIISDSIIDESQRIGVKIERHVAMAKGLPAGKISFSITNISGKTLKDIALGYYLDWDIGNLGNYNYSRYFSEAIPTGITNAAAEMITRDGGENIGSQILNYPVAGWIVHSTHPTAQPQMAGISVADFIPGDFGTVEKIKLMNSGTTLQTDKKTDIGMAAGMKFSGDFLPNETRSFDLCIGAAMSETELANTLKSCLSVNSVKNEKIDLLSTQWTISPNPANDEIVLSSNQSSLSKITLSNILGEVITTFQTDKNTMHISTAQLPIGLYLVHIQNGNINSQLPIIIFH